MRTSDSTVVAGILAGGTVAVPAVTSDDIEIDDLKVRRPLTEKDMTGKPFHGKAVFGDRTIVPGFYTLQTGARTHRKFEGKTILCGQQIEGIIAYLQTLEE